MPGRTDEAGSAMAVVNGSLSGLPTPESYRAPSHSPPHDDESLRRRSSSKRRTEPHRFVATGGPPPHTRPNHSHGHSQRQAVTWLLVKVLVAELVRGDDLFNEDQEGIALQEQNTLNHIAMPNTCNHCYVASAAACAALAGLPAKHRWCTCLLCSMKLKVTCSGFAARPPPPPATGR